MVEESLEIEQLPELNNPIFIAGFDGWGNALDISRGMVDFLVRKLNAEYLGRINPDLFYRFDENRPMVNIKDGFLMNITPPGGTFFVTRQGPGRRDLIFLRASEPNLRWYQFVNAVLSLCEKVGAKTIISLGGMYDNVLHSDVVISGLASSEELLGTLHNKKVMNISYEGPGAIHSTLHSEALKQGFECMSLWCHCPYYLQGTTHFGMLYQLGSLLSSLGGFEIDLEELAVTWKEISKQIQSIIEKSPELQKMIDDLRKEKIRGSWADARKQEKVIHLEDFLKTR
ncbi:MAG: PAC2 family protein [Deltaproteobacteria bacterium]|nr:PAC2 family protein [Deltaproteobacteria bacterium]